MKARWDKQPTGSTCDDCESYDPERESARYFFHLTYLGKEPIRIFNTVTGDITVTSKDPDLRPLRFVQRRIVRTTQETETRFRRHV